MANEYVSSASLAGYVGATDGPVVKAVAAAATLAVDSHCATSFVKQTTTSTRTFRPLGAYKVSIDDCWEITTVKTDDADSGTFGTTWATTDYDTDPPNGVGSNGRTGWPVRTLNAVGNLTFPCGLRRTVQVDAKWGWSAVPDDVIEACYLIGSHLHSLKNVPLGVSESDQFGGMALKDSLYIVKLLAPYRRYGSSTGKFLVG